ncbi:MAG: hypothetical protein KDK66_07660 [Deltaproteobacteria bacterium]|nr:hypothetical protein [Deltaproteobacteria bacterium]
MKNFKRTLGGTSGLLNKICLNFLALLLVFLGLSSGLQAEETKVEKMNLVLAPLLSQEWCAHKPLEGLTLVWKGVQDERVTSDLGVLNRKSGEVLSRLVADPNLKSTLDTIVPKLLSACGVNWAKKDSADPLVDHLSSVELVVKTFGAQNQKGFFSAKAQAESQIEVKLSSPTRQSTAVVAYQLEFKQIRKKGSKALRQAIQELYQETLKQLILVPEWKTKTS